MRILSLTIILAGSMLLSGGLTGCKKDSNDTSEAKAETSQPVEKKDSLAENIPSAQQNTQTEEEHDLAQNPKLNVGDEAPSWELDSDNAGKVSSDSLKGQKYILYFYPKDNTKGCTTEAIDFQSNIKAFADKGYKVFGVSSDSVDSHKGFRENHDLEFTLLSDPDHKVAEAYGVYREKNMYGKTSLGTVRSTFVIDESGNVAQIHDNVRATGHVERLLSQL